MRNQLRIAVDNKYDEDCVKPDDFFMDVSQDVPMADIYDLIEPAFPRVALPGLEAILKRASLIVNTKDFFYVKLAEVATAKRYRMPKLPTGEPTMPKLPTGELRKLASCS